MQIEKKELQYCIKRALEISEVYRLRFIGGCAFPLSVDNLVDLVQSHENKSVSINLIELSYDSEEVRGFYLAFESEYKIFLLEGQNRCWIRFVQSKELFHVLLDNDEYRNINLEDLIDDTSNSFQTDDAVPDKPAVSEMLAEIAAMQFLFPYSDRLELLNNNNVNYLQIAQTYKVPQVLVERYMSPSYMDALKPD
jgi:Zn-dependent peptidase ImmA (M78 family)